MTKIIPLSLLDTLKTIQQPCHEDGRDYLQIVQYRGNRWVVWQRGRDKALLVEAPPSEFARSTITN